MSVNKTRNSGISIGVVGAGPAGALVATLLAYNGFRVSLFERQRQIKRKICGEYLCPKGLDLLTDLGIVDYLTRDFGVLNGMVILSPENTAVETEFPRNKYGLALNREVFDQRLLQLAIKCGVEFHSDWTLSKVHQNKDGKWEIQNIEEENLCFDLLIAADGRQSKIGHYLGHINELNTKRTAIHCYLSRKNFNGLRKGEMHIFSDGSYCGLDPISDTEVNFSLVVDSEILKEKKPEDLIRTYIESSERLRNQLDWSKIQPSEINIVTCLKNKNDFIAGSNLAYVGDAAGFIDPLTGEGIYNALLNASILVQSILTEKTIEKGLLRYKKEKKIQRREKEFLNLFFQTLIRHPQWVNFIGRFLKKKKARGDIFIGIIGNIFNPLEGLIRLFLV